MTVLLYYGYKTSFIIILIVKLQNSNKNMDMGTMNGTRKIINKIDQGRKELGAPDGKTKDRVEGWRKNI